MRLRIGESEPNPRNQARRFEAVRRPLKEATDGHLPGLIVSPRMKMARRGLGGGYRCRKLKLAGERYAEEPEKNPYSHPSESVQYVLLGGGEYAEVSGRQDKQANEWRKHGRVAQDAEELAGGPDGDVRGTGGGPESGSARRRDRHAAATKTGPGRGAAPRPHPGAGAGAQDLLETADGSLRARPHEAQRGLASGTARGRGHLASTGVSFEEFEAGGGADVRRTWPKRAKVAMSRP